MSGLISKNCIVFDIEADNKKDVLKILVNELLLAEKISDADLFLEDVLAREAISPTYVGFEMGMPHGKTGNVLNASVCFGRTVKPVLWNEEAGESADLIIMIAVPAEEAGNTHMKILANLSRKLMHEDFRESLRMSGKEEVFTILEEVLEG